MWAVFTGYWRSVQRLLPWPAGFRSSAMTVALLVIVGLSVDLAFGRRDVELVPVSPGAQPVSYDLRAGARSGEYRLKLTGITLQASEKLSVVPVVKVTGTDDVELGLRGEAAGTAHVLSVIVSAPPGTYKFVLPGYRPFATVRASSGTR